MSVTSDHQARTNRWQPLLVPLFALGALTIGVGARAFHAPVLAERIWWTALVLGGLPVVWQTARHAWHGRFATDIVAVLAIVASLGLGEPLAGLIVVLMQSGGEALERYAEGRASRAIYELELLAPRIAHRLAGDQVEDIPVNQAVIGDLLLVRPGELIPCDGVVALGRPHLDLSRLNGEPVPVAAEIGTVVRSGATNLESPFQLRVTAPAARSEYAKIVELVRTAQASKAPLQRLADRYAVWFTPLTLLACAVTYALTHDPLRVLAVLVVATPCPLILAAPVAIVGGISRAAARGIVFRNGSALEHLATIDTAIFDKTGTLTIGQPRIAGIQCTAQSTEAELLRLAASVEQGSGHLLARGIVAAATARGLDIPSATEVSESPGHGVTGTVTGHLVAVGGWQWLRTRFPAVDADFTALMHGMPEEGLRAFVAIDGRGAGVVEYADQLRPNVGTLIAQLGNLDIRRLLLLSGDRDANTRHIGRQVGIAEARGDMTPTGKTDAVRSLVKAGHRVLMIGDGTNDAPALTEATVGIALASGGGGIAAEAADAVILANDPTRVSEAIIISRTTLRIARQSIWVGLGLSAVAMMFGATGFLPPVAGAVIQEAIDVAVILNALRASRLFASRLTVTPSPP